ncbi:MAG: hypothetical protein JEZ10_07345, partial [Verrucomicrobia bacterium]|nr:hypothetical protein [Verrucomicrobiota bacterium]
MKPCVCTHKNETSFVVHSTTKRLWLMLFDKPDAETPSREIEMTRSDGFFRAKVTGLKPGTCYLYR